MAYRYEQNYRVRYDECDLNSMMTPAGILRYCQDLAGRDAGQHVLPEGGNWVARRTVLIFRQPVLVNSEVEAATFPIGASKVLAQRGYSLTVKGQTESAVEGYTLWVYLNTNGRPTRLPASFFAIWFAEGLRPLPPPADWPAFPTRPAFTYHLPVLYSHLDVMQHVNNAAYLELLDNAAWVAMGNYGVDPLIDSAGLRPLDYDIEYLGSAVFGEELSIHTWFDPTEQPGIMVRWQQIYRKETLLVRAASRWQITSPSKSLASLTS